MRIERKGGEIKEEGKIKEKDVKCKRRINYRKGGQLKDEEETLKKSKRN